MLKPKGHFLLVEILVEKYNGVLHIIEEKKNRDQLEACDAQILAIGPDAWHDKPTRRAEVGSKILIAKYAGVMMDAKKYGYEDKILRLIDDEDVLAEVIE